MQNATDSPVEAWKQKLTSMTPRQRQQLALQVGVSDRAVAYWMAGKSSPRAYAEDVILAWGEKRRRKA
jgi:hypothetical protein